MANRPLHRWFSRALWLLLPSVCHQAIAQEEYRSPWLPSQVFVQQGMAEAARSTTLGVAWTPNWERPFLGGQADARWEASLGRWHGESDPDRPSAVWVTQFGLTPILRWRPGVANEHLVVEAGIGLNILAPGYRRHSKSFSTAFNFGDHIAVGWRFGEAGREEISFRMQHYSNAGIRLPNPGENFRQLRYTHSF